MSGPDVVDFDAQTGLFALTSDEFAFDVLSKVPLAQSWFLTKWVFCAYLQKKKMNSNIWM
jgi:hypothetical protein